MVEHKPIAYLNRVEADNSGGSLRRTPSYVAAPGISRGSTSSGIEKGSSSTGIAESSASIGKDEANQNAQPNRSSSRRKGHNRGSDDPVTVISPALTEMLRQLHNRLDENAQLVRNASATNLVAAAIYLLVSQACLVIR